MMREKRWFPILYMFLITAAFSTVVIGFTALTRDRVEANERLAFETAVLAVLPEMGNGLRSGSIHQQFVEQVSEPDGSSGGAYTLKKDGQIEAYALPFDGQGFWAPIRGVIGIAKDKRTVIGISFYEQAETPGLGAEIVKPAFCDQFKSKLLSQGDKPISIRRSGSALGESDVYAVTGATQTSVRLEAMVNDAIKTWQAKVGGEEGNP